jgi:diguanylate cyclase (GGDEF)-like protein/PAS domain S-box-containing protein
MISPDISLEAAVASAETCIVLADARRASLPIIFVNQAFTDHTGYSATEVIGRNCRFLQGPKSDQAIVDRMRSALARGVAIACELVNYRKNGEMFWNSITINPIHDEAGMLTHFIAFQHDVSSKYAAMTQLVDTEEQLSSVTENLPGYFFRRVMRPNATFHYPLFSHSLFRILGLPLDTDWSENQFIEHMHPDDREEFLTGLLHSAYTLTPFRTDFRIVSPSGPQPWFRSRSTPRAMPDGSVVWEGLAVDITMEKATESKLTHLARHDMLTGLSNRSMFEAAVLEAIAAHDGATSDVALFTIDLDEFQMLNEEWGLPFGDLVLQGVGQRLLTFADAQAGSVARLGGDEFALLLPTLSHSASLPDLAEAIRQDLLRPMTIGDCEVAVEACVGSARYPHGEYPPTGDVSKRCAVLMKQADSALLTAKRQGGGTCHIYSGQQDDTARNRLTLRRSLQHAIAGEQFLLSYQPMVDLGSGTIVGAEALVRWNHPDLGLQGPDAFIPYAEQCGLIVPLGEWIMCRAMQQVQAWRRQGLSPPRIAINVSGVQLQRPGFIAAVEQALRETDCRAENFEFELTEGTLIEAATDTHRQLRTLRKMGFGLAIDDFGTGHSTFKYLRDFPVSKIKIDQTFIRQLVLDSNDALIIRAMIGLSRSLNLQIVAEGIETLTQRDFLRDEGCQVGQGYLFSLPLAAEDFAWLLETGCTLPVGIKKI